MPIMNIVTEIRPRCAGGESSPTYVDARLRAAPTPHTGQEAPERQRDDPRRERGAQGPQAGHEQRGKERKPAAPPVCERPDEVRPHDVADQPDSYRHELHVVGAQGELLDDGRQPKADVGNVVEDEEVG